MEEKQENRVGEGIPDEFMGIINYSVMGILQLELKRGAGMELTEQEVSELYDSRALEIKKLMLDKNHDYGEAWRDMRISSMTDLILMKLLRIKQIEDNKGETLISEGIKSGYQDILNYSVFALIKMKEKKEIS